ncbi:MAG: hypothetical protein ACKOWD_19050 [Rhodoferax sp.]
MKFLVAGWLAITSLTVIADGLDGSVQINARKLKQIQAFEKFKRFSDRQKLFASEYIDMALMIDASLGIDEFTLMVNDIEKTIKVGKSGELLIPSIGEALSDKNSALMLPYDKYKDNIDVSYRIKIKLPLNENVKKETLLTAVKQYELAMKSMFGWASFSVPTLDCLGLVYENTYTDRKVAILDDGVVNDKIIKTNHKGMMFLDFSKPVETLKILEQPMWIFGCKYSRWKVDWE